MSGYLNSYILPAFGDAKMGKIKPMHIEALKKTVTDKALTLQTVRHVLACVRQIYRKALLWGVYTGSVPTDGVEMPRVDAGRMRFFNEAAAKMLLDKLAERSPQWHDIAYVSLYTGIRLGEILALKVGHLAGLLFLKLLGIGGNDHATLKKYFLSRWDEYCALWNSRLDAGKGDSVLRFDVHNWGGARKGEKQKSRMKECIYLVDRIFIHASGNLALCCGDSSECYDLGNAFTADPLELFNSGKFVEYRTAMREGRIDTLPLCRECTIFDCYKKRISPDD